MKILQVRLLTYFSLVQKKKINQIPVSYYKIEKNRILYREFNSNQDNLKEIPFNTRLQTFLLGTDNLEEMY